MTYLENIKDDSAESLFLIVLTPKRPLGSGWSNYTGNVFSLPFDYGFVTELNVQTFINGVSSDPFYQTNIQPEASLNDCVTLGPAGNVRWFYDQDAKLIYMNTYNFSGFPPSTLFPIIIAKYELYVGTKAVNWHRNPIDESSFAVHFEGVVSNPPSHQASTQDIIFGVMPISSANLEIIGLEQNFTRHFYDTSWSEAKVDCYHVVGELQSANIKKAFTGLAETFQYSMDKVSFRILDQLKSLDKLFATNPNYLILNIAPLLHVAINFMTTLPCRQIYGRVDGFKAINANPIIYNNVAADRGNKQWALHVPANINSPTQNVSNLAATNSSTTTRTYLNSSSKGYSVDDNVIIYKGTFGSPSVVYYSKITAVGSDYIEHDANAGAADSTFHVFRSMAGYVTVVSGDIAYNAFEGRDYTITAGSTTVRAEVWAIIFNNSAYSNMGMPADFSQNDHVVCRLYSERVLPKIGGVDFGTTDSQTGIVSSGIQILYQILKDAGISESAIDAAQFQALYATVTDQICIVTPETTSSTFGTFRDVINKICLTLLLKLFIDENNKWTIRQIKPLTSPTVNIADEDIVQGSLVMDLDYSEIASDIELDYWFREEDPKTFEQNPLTFFSYSNPVPVITHGIIKQKTFSSYHMANRVINTDKYESSAAAALGNHLAFIFSERICKFMLQLRHPFMNMNLGDIVSLNRAALPGNEFNGQTIYSRNFSVNSIKRSQRRVEVTLDDQFGIQQNAGSW